MRINKTTCDICEDTIQGDYNWRVVTYFTDNTNADLQGKDVCDKCLERMRELFTCQDKQQEG